MNTVLPYSAVISVIQLHYFCKNVVIALLLPSPNRDKTRPSTKEQPLHDLNIQ